MSEAAPAAPAAPEAAPAPAAPAPEVTATPVEETKPAEQVAKTFTQDELNDILEKRLAKERRRRKEIEDRLRITEELHLKRQDQEKKPAPQPESLEPKREQFDTYESFIEARAEWRAAKEVEKRLREREEKESRTRTEEQQKKQAEGFMKRVKESGIEDFDEVLSASQSPLTDEMKRAITVSEEGPKVAYHLAKNEQEAERIASLPAEVQAREVWKLEQKLAAAPAPKKPSAAPAPIKPGGGASAPTDEMPKDTDDIKDWMKKEEARARKKQGLSA